MFSENNQLSVWTRVNQKAGKTPISALWCRFEAMYLNLWRSNFKSEGQQDSWESVWSDALSNARVTPHDVAAALEKCAAKCEMPPTLPMFLSMCRVSIDPVKAYYEAIAGVAARRNGNFGLWTHPAIYFAAMPLSFDLCSQTHSNIRQRWEMALEKQIALGTWPEIPAPVAESHRLPKPVSALSTKELMCLQSAVSDAGAALEKPRGFDHRTWANKIRDRYNRGDKSLSWVAIKNANEVLHFLKQAA